MTTYTFFASAPRGLELLLVEELRGLGAADAKEKLAGVEFTGDLTLAYKACLWSRLANRILLSLTKVPAETPEALYAGVQTIRWDEHLDPEGTLAVHCVCAQSEISHTLFAAQKVKDAVVDQMRDKYHTRPSVARVQPDVSIYVYLYRNEATIYIDLSGESMHRRGYRLAAGDAPLKENLAAAILLRAGWPAIAKAGGSLCDPMCGSGTLLIEAGLMASDTAPGLLRDYFGLMGWKQHQPACWEALVEEAMLRREQGSKHLPDIVGYDQDPEMIKIAFGNIERAGFLGSIHVEKRELSHFEPKKNMPAGLVITNPPYGERLGEIDELRGLYALLGSCLAHGFVGWKAGIFTGNSELGKHMGLRARQQYALYNGSIPCKLLLFDVAPEWFVDNSPAAENERRIRHAKRALAGQADPAQQAFSNRLRKNFKHLSKQAKRQGITSYRVYDVDLPEYKFAIDVNEDSVHVIEYASPRSVKPEKILLHRHQVLSVLPDVLGVPASAIFYSVTEPSKHK